jgi:LmbE family N-acetylglucosaminyl deacetylase
MVKTLKLMGVVAHPDDESLGMGATLAKYAAEGVEITIISATRGERGWVKEAGYPGPEALGKVREAELRAAAEVLGARAVYFLDYLDGELDRADHAQAVARLVGCLREVKPQVVVTFGPEGSYGHPDHIAICQITQAAVVCAADQDYRPPEGKSIPSQSHVVSKLYYMVDSEDLIRDYEAVVGELSMEVGGQKRSSAPWEAWAITTWIETGDYVDTMWEAVQRHQSQVHDFGPFLDVPEAELRRIFGRQSFYRVYSLVTVEPGVEGDLFAGLR